MFDFAADARDQGGEPGMNHKGLVTFDRKTKKDSFYLYKAWWSEENFVHICSKRFTDRTEKEIEVKVYSNQNTVALYADGKKLAEQTGEHIFRFRVPLHGKVELRAVAGDCIDTASFCNVAEPNPSYKLVKDQVQECKLGLICETFRRPAVVIEKRRRIREKHQTEVRLWSVLTGLTAILTVAAIVGKHHRKPVRYHPQRRSECIYL